MIHHVGKEVVDLVGSTEHCGSDCHEFIVKWLAWWERRVARAPLAMIRCSSDYVSSLKKENRRMVRRARQLYTFESFVFNDRLREIEAINKSKKIRGGQRMHGWYTKTVEPMRALDLCEVHKDTWYGAFNQDDVLMAYARFTKMNEIGVPNSILGHKDAVAAMNGLWAHLVENGGVTWVNYLHMAANTPGLLYFKRGLGFQEVQCD